MSFIICGQKRIHVSVSTLLYEKMKKKKNRMDGVYRSIGLTAKPPRVEHFDLTLHEIREHPSIKGTGSDEVRLLLPADFSSKANDHQSQKKIERSLLRERKPCTTYYITRLYGSICGHLAYDTIECVSSSPTLWPTAYQPGLCYDRLRINVWPTL